MTGTSAVFLHIGGPSTGTTFVQGVLESNRDALAGAGIALPGEAASRGVLRAQFNAVKYALRWRRFADHPDPDNPWSRMAGQMMEPSAAGWLLSMEFLCFADHERARWIVESLAGTDTHVILTVRDSAAVLRSQWQTHVRNADVIPFGRYLHGIRDAVEQNSGRGRTGAIFSRTLDVGRMIDVWGPLVGPDRLHVVTVPGPDSTQTLWDRFAAVLGIDPAVATEQRVHSNTSLGHPSTEFLRRVNVELRSGEQTMSLALKVEVKNTLAKRVLAGRAHLERPVVLPRPTREHCLAWNDHTRAAIRAAGVGLTGSLDDLPTEADLSGVPDTIEHPTRTELHDAADAARSGMVDRLRGSIEIPAFTDSELRGPTNGVHQVAELIRRAAATRTISGPETEDADTFDDDDDARDDIDG